jgi:hypothetical protein
MHILDFLLLDLNLLDNNRLVCSRNRFLIKSDASSPSSMGSSLTIFSIGSAIGSSTIGSSTDRFLGFLRN